MKQFLFLGLLLYLLNYSFLDAAAAADNSLAPVDQARAERTQRLLDLCAKESLFPEDLQEVDHLVEEGVDVNQSGQGLFVNAIFYEHIAVIKKLLEISEIDVWKSPKHCTSALDLSFRQKKQAVTKLLLPKLFETIQPPFVKERDDIGKTILFYAIFSEDYNMIKQLLEWGAEPNTFDCYGTTPVGLVAQIKSPATRDELALLLLHFGMLTPAILLSTQKEKNWISDINDFYKDNKAFLDSIISDKEKVLEALLTAGCPICLEVKALVQIIKNCGHSVCRDCYQILDTARECPLCRGRIEETKLAKNIYTEEQQKELAPMATE